MYCNYLVELCYIGVDFATKWNGMMALPIIRPVRFIFFIDNFNTVRNFLMGETRNTVLRRQLDALIRYNGRNFMTFL